MTKVFDVLGVLAITMSPITVLGESYIVDQDGNGDFETIQSAIDAAQDGDEVLVTYDTYTGPENKNLDFQGKAIHVKTIPETHRSVIDLENNGRAVNFNDGEGLDSVFEGFSIRNGRATVDLVGSNRGGGIYVNLASPTIRNVEIRDCFAETYGGGIAVNGGHPQIIDCDIAYCDAGDPTSPSYAGGGGLSLYGSRVLVRGCRIEHNYGNLGGGIKMSGGGHMIEDTMIIYNEAVRGGGVGVISSVRGTDQIKDDTTIQYNEAVRGGGVYLGNAAKVIMEDAYVVINEASDEGGGVQLEVGVCRGESPMLLWSRGQVYGNTAPVGGGFYSDDGHLALISLTISYNNNYAVFVDAGSTTPLPMTLNCTFSNNTPEDFNY
jgi:hypothetical protein